MGRRRRKGGSAWGKKLTFSAIRPHVSWSVRHDIEIVGSLLRVSVKPSCGEYTEGGIMTEGKGNEALTISASPQEEQHVPPVPPKGLRRHRTPLGYVFGVIVPILLLFLNFFLAQYDKFVLSYFQADVIRTLNLSPANYGILSGEGSRIVEPPGVF